MHLLIVHPDLFYPGIYYLSKALEVARLFENQLPKNDQDLGPDIA